MVDHIVLPQNYHQAVTATVEADRPGLPTQPGTKRRTDSNFSITDRTAGEEELAVKFDGSHRVVIPVPPCLGHAWTKLIILPLSRH